MSIVPTNESNISALPSSDGRFPEFFIIGAPKCGTTTLYHWLSRHPLIYMPFKELSFFSQDIFSTRSFPMHIPSLDSYMEIFGRAPNSKMICGEATPRYLYSDQAIAEIARLSPNSKIIVCLRDPVELVISYHSQKVREGWEREPNLAKAWLRAFDRQSLKPVSTEAEVDGLINYFFWGRIGARVRKLFASFPKDNVKIVLLSELRAYPRKTYLDILQFLGVDDDGRSNFTPVNERVRVRNLAINSAALLLRRQIEPLLAPIRKLRGGRGLGFLKALNVVNTQRGKYIEHVPQELRVHMYNALEDDIRLAETYLDGHKLVGTQSGI